MISVYVSWVFPWLALNSVSTSAIYWSPWWVEANVSIGMLTGSFRNVCPFKMVTSVCQLCACAAKNKGFHQTLFHMSNICNLPKNRILMLEETVMWVVHVFCRFHAFSKMFMNCTSLSWSHLFLVSFFIYWFCSDSSLQMLMHPSWNCLFCPASPVHEFSVR